MGCNRPNFRVRKIEMDAAKRLLIQLILRKALITLNGVKLRKYGNLFEYFVYSKCLISFLY